MTPATDDDAFEAAFEALLAGRGVPPAAEGLVAFADGVRASAARPPRPSAALADLLATGLLTDQSSAPAPRAVRSRRRSTRRMFLAFFAKFAAAGVAAKAAVVGGVVVVGVSTAGFTGALPDGIQHDFASVVDTATPLTAPDPVAPTTPLTTPSTTATTGTEVTDPSGTTTAPEGGDGSTVATDPSTVPAQQTPSGNGLGSQVAGKVVAGSVGDKRVSDLAHERNEARRSGTAATAPSTAPASPSASDDDSDDDGSTSTATTDDRSGKGSSGKGRGNG
jgi:hypothetical protein